MDETLLLLANEVRGKTLRSLDGIPAELARYTGPGLNNSPLWHAGHALVVVEHLCLVAATGSEPAYPKGWFEMFSWKSVPASVPRDAWPSLAEVVEKLKDQLTRLQGIIGGLTPEQLDRVADPARGRTLRYSILHGLHDEAGHQGEIHLLKKLHGKQTGGGRL